MASSFATALSSKATGLSSEATATSSFATALSSEATATSSGATATSKGGATVRQAVPHPAYAHPCRPAPPQAVNAPNSKRQPTPNASYPLGIPLLQIEENDHWKNNQPTEDMLTRTE